MAIVAANRKVDKHTTAIMAVNRKVDTTTTRPPSWRPCGNFINFSIARHDGDRVVDLSTFLLPAMMAIVW
jgi:hypothetical protein